MTLTDEQKRQISQWLEAGLKLAEVQNKLSQAGINLTYMELKFLLADLELKPKDQERPPEPTASALTSGAPAPDGKAAPAIPPAAGSMPGEPEEQSFDELPPEPAPAAPGGGEVTLRTDQVTRAGAIVSGSVTFSDGKLADWYIDQMGRLGVASREQGYRPPQADLMIFQTKLQGELAKLGF